MTPTSQSEVQQQLSDLFGSYRAEWLQERVFDLFTEPRYFPELTTRQSCVLEGGRGTGKTTVLRGLSYQGQRALLARNGQTAQVSRFIGLYHRINTNHVTAFQGAGLDEQEWTKVFAHYFNLLLCELLLVFAGHYEHNEGASLTLSAHDASLICTALHLPTSADHASILESLVASRTSFEAHINNIVDVGAPALSLQQRPVDLLCHALLTQNALAGRHFFFILDEYENLLPYQQKVVNTFIKHTPGEYFFKIGVRELGWSCRSTLRIDEQLQAPADYALIRIGDRLQGSTFLDFATDVCETRLRQVEIDGHRLDIRLDMALPGLTTEEEADLLGVAEVAREIVKDASHSMSVEDCRELEQIPPLELYFLNGWAQSQRVDLANAVRQRGEDAMGWRQRFDNYKYASLFALRKNKRGIDKYYAGLDTYALMAGGNIRYMLELVDQSLLSHIREDNTVDQPISPEIQTKVAQRVGSMNLSELEGLSVSGAKLTRLLLGMGRIFQHLAADPFGHAPEVNQFHLVNTSGYVDELIKNAVMHLALVRYPGTKLGAESNTLEYDYAVHPIFSALFEFSPRKKRKMELHAELLELLLKNPKDAIQRVLKSHRRVSEIPLPRQLSLFSQFYSNAE